MKELEEKFAGRFDEDAFATILDHVQFDQEWQHAADGLTREEMSQAREEVMRAQEEALIQHEELQQQIQQNQQEVVEQQMQQAQQMKEMAEDLQNKLSRKMKSFEQELKEQLIKDGYADKTDKIETINRHENGRMEVNGKEIKEAHREKYNELYNKYFKEQRNFRYVE